MKSCSLLLFFCLGILGFATSCGGDDDEEMIPEVMFTRADYLGVYTAEETCEPGPRTYDVRITAGTGANEITIINLFNLRDELQATVNGKDLVIPDQLAPSFRQFSGTGTLTMDELTLNYKVNSNSQDFNCRTTLTPQ